MRRRMFVYFENQYTGACIHNKLHQMDKKTCTQADATEQLDTVLTREEEEGEEEEDHPDQARKGTQWSIVGQCQCQRSVSARVRRCNCRNTRRASACRPYSTRLVGSLTHGHTTHGHTAAHENKRAHTNTNLSENVLEQVPELPGLTQTCSDQHDVLQDRAHLQYTDRTYACTCTCMLYGCRESIWACAHVRMYACAYECMHACPRVDASVRKHARIRTDM